MTGRAELLDRRAEWLLEMTVNGRPFRFATAPVTVTRIDGTEVEFREGLANLEGSVIADGATDRSVSIQLDASESWDELVARFLSIERSPVIVRRWFEGQLLERARILIEGRVDGLRYGERLTPIRFSVLRQVRTDSRMFPTPAMVIDDTTWPVRAGYTTDSRLIGVHYPVIIGAPGTDPGGGAARPATEGMMVELHASNTDELLLIAGHRVLATSVRVLDFTDSGSPAFSALSVSEAVDGVGRTVSVVDMAGFSGTVDSGRDYYIGWSVSNGGGLVSPITGGLMRGGGDIAEWALRTFTNIKIDSGRFAAVRERLNAYLFDTHVNEPVDPLDWLNSEILSVLPVEPRQGEDGLYFYVRRWEATASDAIARLDADIGQIELASDVETRSESVVNEVTVKYGPNRASGRFRFRTIVGPTPRRRSRVLGDEFQAGLPEDDPRIVGSYRAALSQEKYGRQPIEIELNSVWDPATAIKHAQDILAAQALPRRFVAYTAQTDLEALDVGDVVVLNDSAVKLFEVVALVVDVVIGGPEVQLEFEILDDPVLIERGT